MKMDRRRAVVNGVVVDVVAVKGYVDDWAAYQENDYTRSLGNATAVIAQNGSKLRAVDGVRIYPDWAERLEWRR